MEWGPCACSYILARVREKVSKEEDEEKTQKDNWPGDPGSDRVAQARAVGSATGSSLAGEADWIGKSQG